MNSKGLIEYDHRSELAKPDGAIIFIDHPGLGCHNFPHQGIDRNGSNCAVNIFYCGFLDILSKLAESLGDKMLSSQLISQAAKLRDAIYEIFFDGRLFHDAVMEETVSSETSWQTNVLAVYFDMISPDYFQVIITELIRNSDKLCRCSPYFYFFMLSAMLKSGMRYEAYDLIKKEWSSMLQSDATTTWEGFGGDEMDSLCHPWSTAPYLFLLDIL